MGSVIVKIRVMPNSPEINMELLEEKVKKILKEKKVKDFQTEIQPVAFGLRAIIILLNWPEETSLEALEEKLKNLEETSSVNILDMRRAIG